MKIKINKLTLHSFDFVGILGNIQKDCKDTSIYTVGVELDR